MAAVDAKLFGSVNRRGKAFFPDDFNNFCRTFGHAEPIPPALFFINGKKRHGLSFPLNPVFPQKLFQDLIGLSPNDCLVIEHKGWNRRYSHFINPRKNVAHIVGEPLFVHGMTNRQERETRVLELLKVVGLKKEHMRRYPHQFSGGQRQRIGVARALALNPKLIICDEAVSALDVSIRGQVINLLQDLQKEFGLTYLFISHDLSVVEHISDRVAVMYLGKLAELTDSETLYRIPLHPYSQALLSAAPIPDPRRKKTRVILTGDVPSPIAPPPGCSFHTRCHYTKEVCMRDEPPLREVTPNHFAACHFAKALPAANGSI